MFGHFPPNELNISHPAMPYPLSHTIYTLFTIYSINTQYTIYTLYTMYTFYTLYTIYTSLTITNTYTIHTIFTIYTIHTNNLGGLYLLGNPTFLSLCFFMFHVKPKYRFLCLLFNIDSMFLSESNLPVESGTSDLSDKQGQFAAEFARLAGVVTTLWCNVV